MFECPLVTVALSVALYYLTGFSVWSFAVAQPPIALLLGGLVILLVVMQVATIWPTRTHRVLYHADGRQYGK